MNIDMIMQSLDMLTDLTCEGRNEMTKHLSNLNVNKRNEHKTKEFTISALNQNEYRDTYMRILESNEVNCQIYPPNQVGKSASACTMVDVCLKNNTPVIISTDNKTDQQERFYSRSESYFIEKDLICRGISYVEEDEKDPITATTMFYKPGGTMHAVGINKTIGRITGCATTMFYKPGGTMHVVDINQTIGRITGCATPELPRTV